MTSRLASTHSSRTTAAVFFFVVKPYNAILERRDSGDLDKDPVPEPEEITLLRQIAANTTRVG